MIRKLAIALTILSASYAGVVQALGLGEATVQSNLNQPLVAEISLVNTGGLEESEILPGLATREEFLKAGIDRVYFLSDIRFDVKTGPNGEPVVVLTTKKPVREPFLNFLVEIIWPSGRLLREYALLIDPPVFAEDKPIVAAPAPVTPVKVETPQPSVKRSLVSGDDLAVRNSVEPVAGKLAGNSSYGPTSSKDTLWDIATAVRPDKSVSPQQVMLAIQDLNPNAFIDENINKLKAGQILRLPTKDQIQTRSKYAAINQVIEQNAALRKPKRKTPVSSNTQTTAPTKVNNELASGDQLKLVVSDKDSKAADSAGSDPDGMSEAGSTSDEELSITLEKLDKVSLENDELSGKVGALEDQLETLQRLLTLKNDQLAGLQAQMRASEMDAAEEAALTANEETSDASGDAASPIIVEEVSETLVDTKVVDENGEVLAEKLEVQEEVVVAEVQAVEAPADEVQSSDQQATSMQDELLALVMTNPLYQAAIAGVLIVLLLVLWMLSKSRAAKEQEELADDVVEVSEDEVLDGEPSSLLDDNAQEELDADLEQEEVSEADFEADLEASAGDDEKEDVIAEADVYIAYGRLDQAATILEQGVSADPVRVDYRLKLLEVYRDALEVAAFDKQLSELEAIQDQDALAAAAQIKSELEAKVAEQDQPLMGDDLSVEPEQLLDEDEEQALLQGDDNNFDFDVVEPAVELEASAAEVEVPEVAATEESIEDLADELGEELADEVDLHSEELDVDLDIDLEIEDAVDEDPGIDFESVEFDSPEETSDESPANDVNSAVDDVVESEVQEDVLDIELSDELDHEAEIDLELSDELSDELVVDDLALEIDGDELDLELDEASSSLDFEAELADIDDESAESADESEQESEAPSEEAADALVLDELAITDETLAEAASVLGDAEDFEPELSEDEDFDFLEGTDEASTKLDLARAYIDMGDTEGAKEILLEVAQEGSNEQKQQAQDLIDSLDG